MLDYGLKINEFVIDLLLLLFTFGQIRKAMYPEKFPTWMEIMKEKTAKEFHDLVKYLALMKKHK